MSLADGNKGDRWIGYHRTLANKTTEYRRLDTARKFGAAVRQVFRDCRAMGLTTHVVLVLSIEVDIRWYRIPHVTKIERSRLIAP
jgi:hypothetical protein